MDGEIGSVTHHWWGECSPDFEQNGYIIVEDAVSNDLQGRMRSLSKEIMTKDVTGMVHHRTRGCRILYVIDQDEAPPIYADDCWVRMPADNLLSQFKESVTNSLPVEKHLWTAGIVALMESYSNQIKQEWHQDEATSSVGCVINISEKAVKATIFIDDGNKVLDVMTDEEAKEHLANSWRKTKHRDNIVRLEALSPGR